MADISVTAASVALTSGSKQSGTAGETITAGQTVYLKSSDSRLWKGDANVSTSEAALVGVALHGSLAAQPLAYAVADAVINPGATLTAGEIYVQSTTAGGICPVSDYTTGQYLNIVGYATSTSALKLVLQAAGVARG